MNLECLDETMSNHVVVFPSMDSTQTLLCIFGTSEEYALKILQTLFMSCLSSTKSVYFFEDALVAANIDETTGRERVVKISRFVYESFEQAITQNIENNHTKAIYKGKIYTNSFGLLQLMTEKRFLFRKPNVLTESLNLTDCFEMVDLCNLSGDASYTEIVKRSTARKPFTASILRDLQSLGEICVCHKSNNLVTIFCRRCFKT